MASSRVLAGSFLAHGGILAMLLLTGVIPSCPKEEKPPEVFTFFELQQAEPAPQDPQPPAPEPATPEPEPPPRERLVSSDQIPVNTERIRRQPDPPPRERPPPRPTPLTAEQLRERLRLQEDRTPVRPGPVVQNEMAALLAEIQRKMYAAWIKPSGLTAASGFVTKVKIRILKDGQIINSVMVSSSGHSEMDATVMRGVRAVRRLRPLPTGYNSPYKEVILEFRLLE